MKVTISKATYDMLEAYAMGEHFKKGSSHIEPDGRVSFELDDDTAAFLDQLSEDLDKAIRQALSRPRRDN